MKLYMCLLILTSLSVNAMQDSFDQNNTMQKIAYIKAIADQRRQDLANQSQYEKEKTSRECRNIAVLPKAVQFNSTIQPSTQRSN